MKLYDAGITAIVIVVVALVVGYASSRWLGYEDDSPLEEFAEDIVEQQTGWDIDLSPSSPEE